MNRQNGQALVLVIIVAAAVVFLSGVLLLNQKRQIDRSKIESGDIAFARTATKIEQIFDSVHLCTCNLRNIGVNVNNKKADDVIITPKDPITPARPRFFGIHKLNLSNPTLPCDDSTTGGFDNILLEVTDKDQPSNKGALITNSVSLKGFKYQETVRGADRFNVQFSFSAQIGGEGRVKSTQGRPKEISTYVETVNGKIRGCYVPSNTSGPCDPNIKLAGVNCLARGTNQSCAVDYDLTQLPNYTQIVWLPDNKLKFKYRYYANNISMGWSPVKCSQTYREVIVKNDGVPVTVYEGGRKGMSTKITLDGFKLKIEDGAWGWGSIGGRGCADDVQIVDGRGC